MSYLAWESINIMEVLRRRRLFTLVVQIIIVIILGSSLLVQCQQNDVEDDDYNYNNNINVTRLEDPKFLNGFTKFVYNRLTGLTTDLIHSQFAKQADFCVTDPQEDWNRSFNFSDDLSFLSKCILTTRGDLPQRLCTAADLRFYFTNFIARRNSPVAFLLPNKNCNVTKWVSGCEPGWACSSGITRPLDYIESREIPERTSDCNPCCEGFFCPQGLTCMIPCPLGSYCPLATFNEKIGLCDPYNYQLPPEKQNHTCGGANIWADVSRGGSMFCSAGSYCPTNTEEVPCSSGHYCRMGSSIQTGCFWLTSCGSNSAKQSITQYGLMLIIGISVLLFIFYSCYGQIISISERKYAKSREVAVKSVKESAQARARWLAAANAVRKKSSEIQSHISRTLSGRNIDVPSEQGHDATHEVKKFQFQASHSFSGGIVVVPNEQERDVTLGEIFYPPIQEVEHVKEFAGANLEPELKDKRKKSKTKHLRTDTQVFQYAYSQLEREKAQQQQNISVAVDNETRKRPVIQISFRDLTVTLKQKKKHLLKSVTGEISPCRITALMGPSGAGKTTLLSALAGKIVGCSMSGLIFINGKVESIHSYKKIVGFVPQDDVVHGNLNVEENIWFSANCRLSANLPKADKVLIVERVIESLGLQAVRNSLVGTVEKRGISGGQRKRVNVGLELVMEPSLLFLDEPTSGLDSSSSQLLLRALRREALEGVNICMVVHQPSYSLFKMFDDLILLAKGGLTAYHGPVAEVEYYFAQLGFHVPERINPPDYFIDVLEGMAKPNSSSVVTYEVLPLKWMLHKGYPVPSDMQIDVGLSVIQVNQRFQDNSHSSGEQLSLCGEFFHYMVCKLEVWCEGPLHNFLKSKDLSGRRTPSVLLQYKHFLGRMAKQRLREARIQAIDYLILLLAGACLGLIAKTSEENFNAPGYTYTIIATSLLCKIAALRTFSLDKLQYRRERASGISSLAHFFAKDTIDHFNTLIKPLVYLAMFYTFSNPRSTFYDNYVVLLCLVYCVTGIAYVLAIFLEPGPSQLCSVLLPVVLTLLSTQPKDRKFMEILTEMCYPNWALEAFIVSNAKRYYGVWLIQRCGALLRTGYNLHYRNLCISLLMAAGAACRAMAFFGMLTLQKK